MVGVTHKINSVQIGNFQRFLVRSRHRDEEGAGETKERDSVGGREGEREGLFNGG